VNQLSLNYNFMARILRLIVVLLAMVSFSGQLIIYWTGHKRIYGLIQLFDLDFEHNIPTFFSTTLILICFLLLIAISSLKSSHREYFVFHWQVLAAIFFLMAIDETASIHERLVDPTRKILSSGNHLGIFHFSWVIPGIAFIALLSIFFLQFWLHLPAKTRYSFLVAAIVYISGVIGFEMIGGYYAELYGKENLIYNFFVTIEESLEMIGIIVFIESLLEYIANNYYGVQLRFVGGYKK
jgi:hypothetical protein